MQFNDFFSKQASTYARYRPTYPDELFSFIASLCHKHDRVWDCATGNGQAANSLAKYFNQVIATDASRAQLDNAIPHERVTYRKALAEESGLEAHSVDLVTVATAIHWFNHEKFYAEVNRVLKPGGIIAAWAYVNPMVNAEVDKVMEELHDGILQSYWLRENQMVVEGYRDIPFPYQRIESPAFSCSAIFNLHEYEGYLESWSATQRYLDTTGKNPVDIIKPNLAKAWGNENQKKEVKWNLAMLLGRRGR